jgi:hypothetical protein
MLEWREFTDVLPDRTEPSTAWEAKASDNCWYVVSYASDTHRWCYVRYEIKGGFVLQKGQARIDSRESAMTAAQADWEVLINGVSTVDKRKGSDDE